jgi:hypothetical protein
VTLIIALPAERLLFDSDSSNVLSISSPSNWHCNLWESYTGSNSASVKRE